MDLFWSISLLRPTALTRRPRRIGMQTAGLPETRHLVFDTAREWFATVMALNFQAAYEELNPGEDDYQFYAALVQQLDARRVLDLGCGTGVLARTIAAQGRHVTGTDPDPDMLAIAQQGHRGRYHLATRVQRSGREQFGRPCDHVRPRRPGLHR